MNVRRFLLILISLSLNIQSSSSEFIVKFVDLDRNSSDERIFTQGLSSIQQYGLQAICDERCGLPYNGGDLRVMGGVSTKPNQLPWMVYLRIITAEQFRKREMVCGATLIKNKYLLTAAHCLFHTKILSVTGYIGFHNLASTFDKTGHEMILPVVQAFLHDAFNPVTMQNDIAVLELARPIRFTDQIHSICLMQNEPSLVGTEAVVAGWGVTNVFGTSFYPKVLLHAKVPIVDLKKCRRAMPEEINFITSQNICAGGQLTDTCWGDSGGPLMWASNSTVIRYSQIGVTSWGVECALEGVPAVYTRVSNQVSWIQYVTRSDSCVPISPT